jgi:serine/threonine protein kinase
MHERNLIHGAIKPQNLFLFGDRVKIGDFGLASLPGTPTAPMNRYMPPEVLRGEAAVPASDLYSLGLVVYELLLGKIRFEQLARGELAPLHELVPGVPAALSSAVEQMTRRAVAYRVGEAKQVLGLLGASSSQGTPSSPPLFTGLSSLDARLRPAVPKPALDVKKLKRGLAIALAVVLAGLAISTILFLRSQSPSGGSVTAPKTDPAKPAADTSPNGPAAGFASCRFIPSAFSRTAVRRYRSPAGAGQDGDFRYCDGTSPEPARCKRDRLRNTGSEPSPRRRRSGEKNSQRTGSHLRTRTFALQSRHDPQGTASLCRSRRGLYGPARAPRPPPLYPDRDQRPRQEWNNVV